MKFFKSFCMISLLSMFTFACGLIGDVGTFTTSQNIKFDKTVSSENLGVPYQTPAPKEGTIQESHEVDLKKQISSDRVSEGQIKDVDITSIRVKAKPQGALHHALDKSSPLLFKMEAENGDTVVENEVSFQEINSKDGVKLSILNARPIEKKVEKLDKVKVFVQIDFPKGTTLDEEVKISTEIKAKIKVNVLN